jgi:hypothetical protein
MKGSVLVKDGNLNCVGVGLSCMSDLSGDDIEVVDLRGGSLAPGPYFQLEVPSRRFTLRRFDILWFPPRVERDPYGALDQRWARV